MGCIFEEDCNGGFLELEAWTIWN